MWRDERLALQDMLDACLAIERFTGGRSREAFLADEALSTAVLYKLLIIGEAAHHVRRSTQRRYPDVGWTRVIGMRNFLAHVYFGVDWELIWNTAQRRVPALRAQLQQIVDEYPLSERTRPRRHQGRR